MIRKFIHRQKLDRFVYRMREELCAQYDIQESYTINQIERSIDRLGYSEEFYRYGYLLFMTEKNVMKAFRMRKIESSFDPACAFLATNLSPSLKWRLGAPIMTELSSSNSSEDSIDSDGLIDSGGGD